MSKRAARYEQTGGGTDRHFFADSVRHAPNLKLILFAFGLQLGL